MGGEAAETGSWSVASGGREVCWEEGQRRQGSECRDKRWSPAGVDVCRGGQAIQDGGRRGVIEV